MKELFLYFRMCWRVYRLAKRQGCGYCVLNNRHGVPMLAIMAASGRDAWLVTDRIIDRYALKVSGAPRS